MFIEENPQPVRKSAHQTALDLMKAEMPPVWLEEASKAAHEPKWEHKTYRNEDDINKDQAFPEGANVGVRTGNGLSDIDLEEPAMVAMGALLLPDTGTAWGRTGQAPAGSALGITHYLYRTERDHKRECFYGADGRLVAELRGSGCQSVVPDSRHPDGDWYEWKDGRMGRPAAVALSELKMLLTLTIVCAELADKLGATPGITHNTLLAFTGLLYRNGFTEEQAGTAVKAICLVRNDPDEVDRRKIVESTYKKEKKEVGGLAAFSQAIQDERLADWTQRMLRSVATTPSVGGRLDTLTASEEFAIRNDGAVRYDYERGKWFHWNDRYWEEVDCNHPWVNDVIPKTIRLVGLPVKDTHQVKAVLKFAEPMCRGTVRSTPGYVNFADGVLNADTMVQTPHGPALVQTPHDPAFGFTYCLDYAPKCGTIPNILDFLKKAIPDEAGIFAFMTQVGLAMRGDCMFHVALVLVGPKCSGKGTCGHLANACCGQPYQSFAGASLFEHGPQGMWSRDTWCSSRIVCVDELPAEAIKGGEIFKSMVAHEGVSRRKMHQQETKDNCWAPKLLMMTNEYPRYTDHSGAITERLLFVQLPHQHTLFTDDDEEKVDLKLWEKLEPEVPMFASICLAAAAAALQTNRFPHSEEMLALRRTIETDGDPLRLWAADHLVLEPGKAVAVEEMHESYCDWCRSSRHLAMARGRFSQALGILYHGKVQHVKHNNVRKLKGLRLAKEADWRPEEAKPRAA
jgi:phage/plasmid-associated DNA primase